MHKKKKEYSFPFHYYSEFGIIEKEQLKFLIDSLPEEDKKEYFKNMNCSKIFFVKWQDNIEDNNIKKKFSTDNLYMGMLDIYNKDCNIYFYLYDKGEYKFEFLIQYNNITILYEEIEHIKEKGIGKYLYELGMNLRIIEKKFL